MPSLSGFCPWSRGGRTGGVGSFPPQAAPTRPKPLQLAPTRPNCKVCRSLACAWPCEQAEGGDEGGGGGVREPTLATPTYVGYKGRLFRSPPAVLEGTQVKSPCCRPSLWFWVTGIFAGWRMPSACSWSSLIHPMKRNGTSAGKLPYLMDGKNKLTQSNAILRYIARKHNMCGETEEEKIRVDIMENQIMDFRMQLIRLCYSPDHEKLKPQYLEQLPGQLKQFSLFLGKYSWFAGEKLTFVDFLTYDVLDQNRIFEPRCLDEFPNLKAFMCRFEALEKIAAYMQSDRFLKMPINNKMAQWGNKRLY
uniref:Glutathione S-transferase n=1 Tax=Sus scrofa TaxID=9823 RepID=A0A8D1YMY6_PIG